MQRFGGEVDHDGLGSRQRHPIRHRFADDDSGDRTHDRSDALDVLNVERRDHVDLGREQFLDVFVAFAVLAAGYVRVRQLVHQDDVGISRENRIDIHFFKNRTLVLELLARHDFHSFDKLFDAFAAVRFHNADDDVFAATAAADRFAEHAEGLADTRGVAQEELEDAPRLLGWRGDFEPLFRLLGQGFRSPWLLPQAIEGHASNML